MKYNTEGEIENDLAEIMKIIEEREKIEEIKKGVNDDDA